MADFDGETSNKDIRSRKRVKDCRELLADLICKILDGDDKYRTTRRWEDKKVIVQEAMDRLRDPHILQQWLRKLQSEIVENPSFSLGSNNACLELPSVLNQPTNPVQDLNLPEEAIEDQTKQLISEAKNFRMVARVLNKVGASYVAKQQLTDPVRIQDLVQTDDESFIFHFPLTPDSSRCAKIRINRRDLSLPGFFHVEKHDLGNRHLPDFFGHQYPGEGSSDARANQENVKLSNENISPVQGHADVQNILANSLTEADHKIESNPERLGLKDTTNTEVLLHLPDFFDRGTFGNLGNWDLSDFGRQYPSEGSSDARANQENMKLSHENTSSVQGHEDFQNIRANSVTEADHKIESNPERLGLKDTTNIEDLWSQFFDVEKYHLENRHLPDFGHQYPGEGSSDARANQENMKLSHENTSPAQGHADFQNILTNSLAEADHKTESNPERLGLRDITNMEETVQNKRSNLEKPRVRKKLEEETKKNKANIAKGKRKVEKGEADLKENTLKMVKVEAGSKENRMKLRKDDAELQENQLKLTSNLLF